MLLITSYDAARENIHRYQAEVAADSELRRRVRYVRAWYAERTEQGWIFAPSKFAGYQRSSARDYVGESETRQRDGRETERTLARWYITVDPSSRVGRELTAALTAFLAALHQVPNTLARINVPKDHATAVESRARRSEVEREALLNRISIDQDICGGRPCIKGTRMRVTDIVDALAHGATQAELLADFDYLTADDIAAALLYAARAADHRVVRTA